MKSLRIILVINSPPLPYGNADARWYYVLLKELVSRSHYVTAFVTCRELQDISKVQNLFPPPEYDLRCYLIPQQKKGLIDKIKTIQQPYSYIFSQQLRQDLATELAKPYDILHLEQLWSGWLGLEYKERSLINIHYLYSLDGTFENNKSLEILFRKFFTHRAEQKLLKAFPKIITLSERLSKHIQTINPQAQIYTVPLGIDFSLYPFAEQKQVNPQPIVGLIGSFNWTPSYSAAVRLLTKLWPEIKCRVPNAKLQIVGRSAQDALAEFTDIEDLEIYQDVPDTLPYFANMDVMLYTPISGSGMKVKVMEAFALGTPVVTNTDGVEGMPAVDGIHAGICEDDQGLIDRTVKLLNNPNIRQERRVKARELLEIYCSPQVTVDQIERIYQKSR
ncbi:MULTISPECIES: glycosyltransferase family 4 protein [Aphanizomenonaceae]|jgi:glycosyltransferase involved in cell wall biosynthesis|uniref:Glycosyltransferase family 4 protein n=1 Tax=Dolichospermum heterosporum TAC447 TaxID=747523 RepID=A0ABY5LW41_9CYAN|nr:MULTISPECIES: glycosyltransferase family 4 protein [Aphanizomenonaceae]MBE9257863.1 glycosyltransferase family 4 protein [Dolichospermum sp. LEGE 00246]UUO16211.1 glycosyltransferase family 4 protein [Dolichospermum heterosporum TAC447]